jgi:hypothetical protein
MDPAAPDLSQPLSLAAIAGPGEAEWWFRDEPDERLTIDNPARLAHQLAAEERMRVKRALHTLGFDSFEKRDHAYEVGRVLSSYTEVFIGPAGTVTVQWNHDPTDPSA